MERVQELGLLGSSGTDAAMPELASWDGLTDAEQEYEARRMETYAGMATAMDEQIGRVFKALEASGELENTVVVFFSDNGAGRTDPYSNPVGRAWLNWHYDHSLERMGEKGSWIALGQNWAAAVNSPFSSYKFSASEGGVRVPLIISVPSASSQSSVVQTFARVNDIAPTLLQLADVEVPRGRYQERDVEEMDGHSLLPVLKGTRDWTYQEPVAYELAGNASVYLGGYKLVRNRAPFGDGQWRLHDLRSDPQESVDLSAANPERVALMLEAYARYEASVGVLPVPEGYNYLKQVQINALLFYYLPRLVFGIGVFLVIVLMYVAVRRRRKA